MQRAVVSLCFLAATAAAQSNTVPGLDGKLDVVNNFTYQGRRGAAYPNGEIGAAMLNTMCNPGTVNIPWYAAWDDGNPMGENHPKFGFLMVRVANDKIEQISDRSFCKHAFTSTNGSGTCGTCISPGTGQLMGVHCSDTYGVGNNADRNWLGPADEINPWLGTWSRTGSYFDVGDAGTGTVDGIKSLSTTGYDSVKYRVTMREVDLTTAGAQYFYGIHLVHEGEALANRWDNLASRGCTPTWNGSTWTFPNSAVGQVYGSILQHWTGATLNSNSNGSDDGRFFVAVKTTALGGGVYHYEYAVHNADNSRGAATFSVPIDAAATASNFTFRDIDQNALNNWTAARVGNEIVFSAPPGNALRWNTIYNFGFNANVVPSVGICELDQALPGAGALSVTVTTKVPSGLPGADFALVGQGCGDCTASFYEIANFDLANRKMKLTYAGGGYSVADSTANFVAPTGGNLSQTDDDQDIYNLGFSLPYPGGTTTQVRICSNGFVSPAGDNGTTYTPSSSAFLSGNARWAACWRDLTPSGANNVYAQTVSGIAYITWQNVPNYSQTGSANTFQVQLHPNGDVHVIWQAMSATGSAALVGWTPGAASDPGPRDLSADITSGFTVCADDSLALAMAPSARPILNTTVNLQITNLPASSLGGVMVFSPTEIPGGIDLGFLNMAGCFGYQLPDILGSFFAAPPPSVNWPFTVPNDNGLVGQTTMFQGLMIAPGFTGSGFLTTNGVRFLYGLL
ncbi:MAG: hypothetical protein JNL08_13960 [Planctomycetes bacterium]|nr:hypothetical protein [Planctomycetota bacterium]